MDAEVVTFQLDTGTGEQTVNLSGSFTPNLIIFFGHCATAVNTYATAANIIFGAASGVSGTETIGIIASSLNGQGTSDTSRGLTTSSVTTAANITTQRFDVTSFGAGSFTIDILASDSSQRFVSALCLNVDDAFVGTFTTKTSTGTQAITGVGFQPDLVIFFTHGNTQADAIAVDALFHIGAMDGVNQFACITIDDDNVGTTVTDRYHDTSACLRCMNAGGGALTDRAEFSAFGSDGFTLNYTDADANARHVGFIAIKAPNVAIKSSYDHPTSTGSQSVTGAGFTPKAVMELTIDVTSVDALHSDGHEFCVGSATGPTEEAAAWIQSEDNVATSNTDRYQANNATVIHGDTSQADEAEADFTEFNSDGHEKNWSVAAGTTRKGACIWLGDTAAGGEEFSERHYPRGVNRGVMRGVL